LAINAHVREVLEIARHSVFVRRARLLAEVLPTIPILCDLLMNLPLNKKQKEKKRYRCQSNT